MKKYLVSLNDLPPGGKEFSIGDQNVWLEPLKEFKMECAITKPLQMHVFVMPADSGCLVRGHIEGSVVLPCNRCAENANVTLDSKFDEYEEIPQEENEPSDGSHIEFEQNSPMLNLADVAWEQFMLALPQTPLCRDDCKGLCAKCGANLNLGPCECSSVPEDDRMAPLRNLKIQKK